MKIKEHNLFKYMDIGFYIIFMPTFLLLIPTDHLIERDPYFFSILMLYIAIVHFINRRHNPLAYIINGEITKSVGVLSLTLTLTILLSRMEALDLRQYNILAPNPQRTIEMKLRSIWMLYFIELCFSAIVALTAEIVRQIHSRARIEEEKNSAELSLYRSQINPHFMLNTLNTLYGLYITKSEKTGDVFLKFTDMIKYTFSNSDKDKVMLCEEVNYISKYIDLHALRLGNQTTISYQCDIDDESMLIPPIILITFIENAFKYGVSSSLKSEIKISISLKNRLFVFKTENTIFSRNHSSTGIGLKNCEQRLNLLYPSTHTLEYGEKEGLNKFYTTLTIRL